MLWVGISLNCIASLSRPIAGNNSSYLLKTFRVKQMMTAEPSADHFEVLYCLLDYSRLCNRSTSGPLDVGVEEISKVLSAYFQHYEPLSSPSDREKNWKIGLNSTGSMGNLSVQAMLLGKADCSAHH